MHLGLYHDETAELCHWHVPEAHYLESWGDVRAFDGTVSLIQPLIAPLYDGRTAIELLSALNGKPGAAPMDLVKEYWTKALGATPRIDAAAPRRPAVRERRVVLEERAARRLDRRHVDARRRAANAGRAAPM